MKVIKWVFMFLLFEVSLFSYVQAQDLIVYPAQGQSNDQMEKDKFECYNWAKGQTGFDPMQMPTASSPAPSQERKSVGGSPLGGGLLGGAGGAVIGGIAGGSSGARKGAAIGGLSGGVRGLDTSGSAGPGGVSPALAGRRSRRCWSWSVPTPKPSQ